MWVWVFLGIAVLAVVVTICYGIWLVHQAMGVFSEVAMLGERAREFGELAAQIGAPVALEGSATPADTTARRGASTPVTTPASS